MKISELRPGEMLVKDFTAAVNLLQERLYLHLLYSLTHMGAHTHYISL